MRIPAAHGAMPARIAWTLALLLLPLLALGLRWASFLPSVIDWDESLYLLQAREWLRGNWPLSGVWDMHPVGAPGMIALAFLVFGENLWAVRLLGALCVAATGYALIWLVRNLGGGRTMAYAAALLYAAHSMLLGGLASNTEILFAPMAVSALALAVAQGEPWRRLLPMGALVGLALLVKPVATPEGCLAFALLVLPLLRARRWREVTLMALAYAALCAAPTLLTGLVYALRGEFSDWFTSSLLAPLQYASGRMSAEQALWRSTLAGLEFRWLILLALPAFAGLTVADEGPRRVARFGLLWLAVALVAVVGPGQFFGHYFLILLPPLSLLAALGLFLAARALASARARAAMLAVLALIATDLVARDLEPRLSRGFALGSPDTPRRMANLMNEELQEGDTIFVPNYQPVVYFLTEARLPTRFPFPVHLTGSFATLAGVDTDAEVKRILESRPRFIVLDRSEWFGMRVSAMAMLSEALEEGYELAASFVEERGTVELWRRLESE
ncbi:ArnT family glycosyltransferase [Sabulicella rubraurantiaca]|uniref:ArnT family glycosyltransferase n=1 Tax=Sabulicella rubraurantiaca TaxID=2811429 RepID=UPI001A960E7F|nr:glycosyltransferase family 39 protein [Sabulicella rubraurantiaca]